LVYLATGGRSSPPTFANATPKPAGRFERLLGLLHRMDHAALGAFRFEWTGVRRLRCRGLRAGWFDGAADRLTGTALSPRLAIEVGNHPMEVTMPQRTATPWQCLSTRSAGAGICRVAFACSPSFGLPRFDRQAGRCCTSCAALDREPDCRPHRLQGQRSRRSLSGKRSTMTRLGPFSARPQGAPQPMRVTQKETRIMQR
jgi:hypothetical protein